MNEISPDKNVNCHWTIAPFTIALDLWASLCCANSPQASALYDVSVRQLPVLLSSFLQTVGHPSALAFG
jgi:hypothetical protein